MSQTVDGDARCATWLHRHEVLRSRRRVAEELCRKERAAVMNEPESSGGSTERELDATVELRRRLEEEVRRVWRLVPLAGKECIGLSAGSSSSSPSSRVAERDALRSYLMDSVRALEDAVRESEEAARRHTTLMEKREGRAIAMCCGTDERNAPLASAPAPAVEAYAAFMAAHGDRLGWSAKDHDRFLQVVLHSQWHPTHRDAHATAGTNDQDETFRLLLAAAASFFCETGERTVEDVQHHVRLYLRQQQLLHSRRIAIEAFQEDRRARAANVVDAARWKKQLEESDVRSRAFEDAKRVRAKQQALHRAVHSWQCEKRERELEEMAQEQQREEARLALQRHRDEKRRHDLQAAREAYIARMEAEAKEEEEEEDKKKDRDALVVVGGKTKRATSAQRQQLKSRWTNDREKAQRRFQEKQAKLEKEQHSLKAHLADRQYARLLSARAKAVNRVSQGQTGVEPDTSRAPADMKDVLQPSRWMQPTESTLLKGLQHEMQDRTVAADHGRDLRTAARYVETTARGAPSWCGRRYGL